MVLWWLLVGTAHARQPWTVVITDTHNLLPPGQVTALDDTLTAWLATDVSAHWHIPTITLTVHVVTPNEVPLGDAAAHTVVGHKPVAYVGAYPGIDSALLTLMVSHELVEMVANPYVQDFAMHNGQRAYREIADPVAQQSYDFRGVNVSDYVFPNYFLSGASGPYDRLARASAPYGVTTGGMQLYSAN